LRGRSEGNVWKYEHGYAVLVAGMMSDRIAGVDRQKGYSVNTSHPYYLHLRSLFADLESAAKLARGRLLDIGCGNKPYQGMFHNRVSEYVGCDVVQSSDNRADVICPATELSFEAGEFDTVLCTQVIEHVADHHALLAEAFRVLRRDGLLILSGPMYWPLHEEPYDFFRFTEHGLRVLLTEAGFADIQIKSNGGKWAVCGQVLIHTIDETRFNHRVIIRAINRIFGYLDDRHPVFTNPMNYVVTCRKHTA
jgi:SAM-dependent methyltransferase